MTGETELHFHPFRKMPIECKGLVRGRYFSNIPLRDPFLAIRARIFILATTIVEASPLYITIPQDHTDPYPKCDRCDLHISPRTNLAQHQHTASCRHGAAKKRRRAAKLALARSQQVVISVDGVPLRKVRNFKYQGCVLSETNSDWPTVYRNLKRARQKWAVISRALT